ncbi:hypothetical protein MPTK1_4g06630 [Marchantia polymorpha subsp. ruderalis]|uniref:Uncharacterized protein n=2 Tax=Marchantia polymorpha TaxID=3197 RepID=A0AAF6B738_MARPO|nr:hypothetical protein MARPO_0125s0008 [Marchantia polymorpha]BBN07822.1 hypothetical protein Mp_4g06630 [Marchantia polymorpha subsp. ruderalis]|eukprot:PTQ30356.1 hypothetical protein MARPO_0125s0008 [Marchantia polymorpha]
MKVHGNDLHGAFRGRSVKRCGNVHHHLLLGMDRCAHGIVIGFTNDPKLVDLNRLRTLFLQVKVASPASLTFKRCIVRSKCTSEGSEVHRTFGVSGT